MMKSSDPIRLGGIILALLAALALAGCSALKLGYANLPNLAWWWLDGYVDFSDDQSPLVRDEIARLHAWHRQEELPQAAALLKRMADAAPGEVDAGMACGFLDEIQQRLHAVQVQGEVHVLAVAATLGGRELRHLERRFGKNNEKFRKEWIQVDREEQLKKRTKRMVERAETFYGRLDEPQRALVRQRLHQSAYDPARSHAEWQRRQQDLLTTLKQAGEPGIPEAEGRALVRGWFARVARAPDAAYRGYQDTLRREGCATFALLHQATTPAQRERAAQRLRTYQRDLAELMAQP